VSVVVRGAPWLLEAVEEALEGAQGILMDLEFGAMGLYSDSTDSQSTTTATCTDMPLTNLTSISSSTPPVDADIDIDELFRHPATLSSPPTSSCTSSTSASMCTCTTDILDELFF